MSTVDPRPIPGIMSIEAQRCVERLTTLEPGAFVSYDELSAACGVNIRAQRHCYQAAFRKLLREEQKVFVVVSKRGIRRLTNDEIPSLGYRDVSQIGRRARRSIRRLSAANYNQLSNEGRHAHNVGMTIMSLVETTTRGRSVKMIEQKVAQQNHALVVSETLKMFEK